MDAMEIYTQAAAAVRQLLSENRPHFNPVKLMVIGSVLYTRD